MGDVLSQLRNIGVEIVDELTITTQIIAALALATGTTHQRGDSGMELIAFCYGRRSVAASEDQREDSDMELIAFRREFQ